MAATYDASCATEKDQVRTLIGDTHSDMTDAYLQDETIEWFLTQEMNVYMAASKCAYAVFMKLSGGGTLEDRKVGETRIKYQAAGRFKTLSDEMKTRGLTYQKPYAGGIYKSDRDAFWADNNKLKGNISHNFSRNPRGPGAATNSTTSA
jgi:hypothetical protein